MATSFNGEEEQPDYSTTNADGSSRVKVICLGDSAVGKSKLVERFLLDGFYINVKGEEIPLIPLLYNVFQRNDTSNRQFQSNTASAALLQNLTIILNEDFWDTAGQERFSSMHPSYYHQAHACILAFDISRKVTYKNLPAWYKELREFRPEIPCLCAANKIDVDMTVTRKSFNFPKKCGIPLYFVSASNGTNVVKLFKDAISSAVQYKKNPSDFVDEILQELANFEDDDEDSSKGET